MADFINGFYKHDQFKLIADPFGFLDLIRFSTSSEKDKKCIYRVPIKDRLGKMHESRNLQDLDIITRFEVSVFYNLVVGFLISFKRYLFKTYLFKVCLCNR